MHSSRAESSTGPAQAPLIGEGLVLQEWTEGDLRRMVSLFDDPDVAYRLPVAQPFGVEAARRFLDTAYQARADGSRIQLAITLDGLAPVGEISFTLLTASIGYMVGAGYRRQGIATRATRLLTAHAHAALGLPTVYLQTEPDNEPSIKPAKRAGFRLSGAKPVVVEDKGRKSALVIWWHSA